MSPSRYDRGATPEIDGEGDPMTWDRLNQYVGDGEEWREHAGQTIRDIDQRTTKLEGEVQKIQSATAANTRELVKITTFARASFWTLGVLTSAIVVVITLLISAYGAGVFDHLLNPPAPVVSIAPAR